ncbi:MAG: DUF1439 domain-containing protein [Methylacidiphilales bacterium]|nr:DUF1439 domain-containing protein [Candidatus Methylacidiphilales bacterium]
MKRLLFLTFLPVCLSVFFLQGCGRTFQIEIPKSQVEKQVKSRFPVTRSGIFSITLQNPDLLFEGSRDRINVDTDVTVRTMGMFPAPGHVNVDGKLEYHPEDATIRLGDIKVRKVNIKGLPSGKHEEVIGMIGNLITPVLKSINLYQLNKSNRLESLASAHLKGFHVKDNSLVVIIGY